MISKLFLGSTRRDLADYRAAVIEAMRGLEIETKTSEHWARGWEDVTSLCAAELAACDAYYGIFAHWYGSVLDGGSLSITHKEFRWARDRLRGGRVAVFRPEPGSKADQTLRRLADGFYAERPQGAALRAAHEAFIEEVGRHDGATRFVNTFRDKRDLRERVMQVAYVWLRRLFQAMGPAGVAPTSAELGAIAGETMWHDLAALRSRLKWSPAALVVLLGEGAHEALAFLEAKMHDEDGIRPQRCSLATGDGSLRHLLAVLSKALGAVHDGVETVEAFASLLQGRRKAQRVVVTVTRLDLYSGGLAALHRDFWHPLHTMLKGTASRRDGTLATILGCAQDAAWDPAAPFLVRAVDLQAPTLDRLAVLPSRPLAQDDVEEWLAACGLEGEPLERLARLAMAAPDGGATSTARILKNLRELLSDVETIKA